MKTSGSLNVVLLVGVLAVGCQTPKPQGTVAELEMADPPGLPDRQIPVPTDQRSLKWLLDQSTLVFIGTLLEQEVTRDSRGLIITHNGFRVSRVLSGELLKDNVVITTLGGKIGRQILRVSHMPEFSQEQQYLIFLDQKRTTYDPVVGNEYGVFQIGPDGGVYNHHGSAVSGIEEGVILIDPETVLETRSRRFPAPNRVSDAPVVHGDVVASESATIRSSKAVSLDLFLEAVNVISGGQ